MAVKQDLELARFDTDLVPGRMDYAVLRPEGSAPPGGFPLLYFLHGGGGSRDFLATSRGTLDAAWDGGDLPPCVVVTPSVQRSFYMDYRDGSHRWETLLTGPFLAHIRAATDASADRGSTAICGISMGGMGGLRMAFRHPELFGAVAALEPGIEPALRFADIELRDRFWRDDNLFQEIYGSPVDEDYWADTNPATIASRAPERLRDTAIYLECGDRDSFGLHRGTEYLHRVLFDAGVSHEYRLVRGADHLGQTLPARFADALRFLGEAFHPAPPDQSLEQFHQWISGLKARAGVPA
ncbi:MAG TPA: alpha/beta hydrolase-fold protein [Acidimicrobiales bacterium]|nr:alpha/beta hydrolase-fold protein [Acidimicrobiales bacterium]